MNAAKLITHFDRFSDSLGAIPRLRRFILELAVRGKLVEQNFNDEPINAFSRDEIKGRGRSKAISSNEAAPYPIPQSWTWTKIGNHLELLNGMAFKSTDWKSSGLKIVRIQNLNRIDAPFNYCEPNLARKNSLIDDGTFLISWSGTPGTSFGAFIWQRGPAVLNQHIFRCDFRDDVFYAPFLRLSVNGRLNEMIAQAHGGVGLQHITKGKLEALSM